jgi:entry exclusion lipoprotein TrbK
MNVTQLSSVALAALMAGLVSACSPDIPKTKEAPIVNDENCKPENIAKVDDEATRKQFASACLRRGPDFKASEKKAW